MILPDTSFPIRSLVAGSAQDRQLGSRPGDESKLGRHPLRLIQPEVFQLAVRNIHTIMPADDVGMFRIWTAVCIDAQPDDMYSLGWTDATADRRGRRMDVKVGRADRPDLCFGKSARAAHGH